MLASLAPELDADRVHAVCARGAWLQTLCSHYLCEQSEVLVPSCPTTHRPVPGGAASDHPPTLASSRPTTHPPTGPSTSNRPLACAAPGAGHGRPDTSHLTTDPT